MTATKGIAFGELALLQNAPRAATVTCTEVCKLWVLDSKTFKQTLMGKSKQDSSTYVEFLKGVPLLQRAGLPDDKLLELASHLSETEVASGTTIITQGEPGDNFYLVREGEVKCTKWVEAANMVEEVKRIGKGGFFGELALLRNDVRAANVIATAPCQLLLLGRDAFSRMLGPLSSIIDEYAPPP